MVLPLYDDNRDRRRVPVVNYILIIINVLVFVFPQQLGRPDAPFTNAFAATPYEIVKGEDLRQPHLVKHPLTKETLQVPHAENPISVYLTLLTSMFMHGGLAHILGNMLFLWIFGDNVEDYLGPVRYLAFYLFCGLLATFAHIGVTYATGADPMIPSLGASGAISGVLGGYLLLYPHKRVVVLLFRMLTHVPAYVAIGMWFLFQIVDGLGALGNPTSGGVAYGAHIGGFIVGVLLVKAFAVGLRPDVYVRVPPRDDHG